MKVKGVLVVQYLKKPLSLWHRHKCLSWLEMVLSNQLSLENAFYIQ